MKAVLTVLAAAIAASTASPTNNTEFPTMSCFADAHGCSYVPPYGPAPATNAFYASSITEVVPGLEIWTYAAERGGVASGQEVRELVDALRARFAPPKYGGSLWGDDAKAQLCRIEVGNQGGGRCYSKTTPTASSGNASTELVHGLDHPDYSDAMCSWRDPAFPSPHVAFNDPGLGVYSIRYTATEGQFDPHVQMRETRGTKCKKQGLCLPQLVFFRRGFRIVLSTWKMGSTMHKERWWPGHDILPSVTDLCFASHFHPLERGGLHYRYVCVVPCWNDANLDAPPFAKKVGVKASGTTKVKAPTTTAKVKAPAKTP